MKLLLIEDDTEFAATLRRGLAEEGYQTDVAHDGAVGLWMAVEGSYDAIVCDLMLPTRSGFKICSELRAAGDWTPLLVLTAKDGEFDEAEALDAGADDYLTKPFTFTVLCARLRALLRRADVRGPTPLTVGDLTVDPAARRVTRGDSALELTAREFDVLAFLVRRAGRVLSKRDILDGVWDHDFDGDPNIVEVYVGRLRRKIDEPFGTETIETLRGAGYRVSGAT